MELPTVTLFEQLLARVLPEPHASLMSGLLFGSKTSLPHDFLTALTRSGTLHIVALSGMNIAIIARMIESAIAGWVGRRPASLLTVCAIVGFIVFVGPSPSIVRAGIMGSIALLAVVLGRQYWGVFAWGVTVGCMVLIHWQWIGDLSFQLSAAATLGILLFGGNQDVSSSSAESLADKFRRFVIENLRITLAAQVLTIPIILLYFRRISLIAPLSNILIGWSIAPLTILGWCTVLAGYLWLPLSYWFAWVDWIFLEYLIRTVYFMGYLPISSIGD